MGVATPGGGRAGNVRGREALGLVLAAVASAAAASDAIEVTVSKRGFSPSRVTVRKGETTGLVLSSSDTEHCFAVDALRIERRVVPGRPTRLDLTPARTGTFRFYCCLESGEAAAAERGELVVTE